MPTPHRARPALLVLISATCLSLPGGPAVGAGADCTLEVWTLELDSVSEIAQGVANPYADTWSPVGTLAVEGEAGPEALVLRVRITDDGAVVYDNPEGMAIEAGEGVGCSREARAYACVAGPRITSEGLEMAVAEGTPPASDYPADEPDSGASGSSGVGDTGGSGAGEEPDPNADVSLRISTTGGRVSISAPSAAGRYTVTYDVIDVTGDG